ncbi:DNA repair protein RecO [Candidatus Falkowbacteria bacterium CG10_big_fil_rev_8_21_14_0_10_39_9]|uniref:DNA repair protein RecO n=1 Tax=Candidatus Falkowbacteria bacterium CG10_big_fil_rev_8_21_14_0_10_39_9 TaxID=1974566 RepID=A0A2M6WNQ1_9BACT|nr:MAG: DNA repair protein RecO [Candidatus Falkowbacteria bacterium CG10_big_fil_rev_8_21_14_0_10_39_9]
MAETFNTKALVLNRYIYREYDSRVTVYSPLFGKIDLLARGVQRPGSKLAAHVEPLSLVDLMIVKGKNTDYIGSSIVSDAYASIKCDLAKLPFAGSALFAFNRLIKPEEKDAVLFDLLLDFLDILDQKPERADWLLASWSLKFLSALGYQPELYNCLHCQKRLEPDNNFFSIMRGGIFCSDCSRRELNLEAVDQNNIKMLRLVLSHSLTDLANLRADNKSFDRVNNLVKNLLNFYIKN